ncbi:MAG: pentapeptide repeat-containing protein [Gammaproteobacteria bacterium]|nr:pentapeptide repeat-containing protein [Gammaproteobacteria bacterium]
MNSTASTSEQWYIRRGEVIRGPFTEARIAHYLLHGRIRKNDELSQDQEQWLFSSEYPQLLPLMLQDAEEDAFQRQQLMARKQWEAQRERSGNQSRYQPLPTDVYSDSVEAARLDLDGDVSSATPGLNENKPVNRMLAGLVTFSLLGAMGGMIYLNSPEPEVGGIDCTVSAAPGVNWSNCQMAAARLSNAKLDGALMKNMNLSRADLRGSQLVGANLSFSNLSAALLNDADIRQATLVGVNLSGADLEGAVFDGADLSYVDFGGANLAGASLNGAKLDKAIWRDGRVCAVDSIGRCQ